jgi:hypothetical protein
VVVLAISTPLAASLILAISALIRTFLRRRPDAQEENPQP